MKIVVPAPITTFLQPPMDETSSTVECDMPESNPKIDSQIIQHNESSILFKLPPEIRMKIYEYICAGHFIKIDVESKWALGEPAFSTLGNHFCTNRSATRLKGKKRHLATCTNPFQNFVEKERPGSSMDLRFLRTCRKVYFEARCLPFKTNVFIFPHPYPLRRFICAPGGFYRNQCLKSLTIAFEFYQRDALELTSLFGLIATHLSGLETMCVIYKASKIDGVEEEWISGYHTKAWDFVRGQFLAMRLKAFSMGTQIYGGGKVSRRQSAILREWVNRFSLELFWVWEGERSRLDSSN